MRKFLIAAFILLLFNSLQAQDSLRLQLRSEFYPIYSNFLSSVGEGLGMEIQKEVSKNSSVGISYGKFLFDQSSARNLEILFYNRSDTHQSINASVGLGFFVRQWSDSSPKIRDTLSGTRMIYTTGYVVSLGVIGRLREQVSISTRVNFSNNTNAKATYSLRQGIIIRF